MPGKKIPEDRRREQILEAAHRVALRERVAGLTSRAVAAEAGVSNGLVFFYFRNRRVLLLALLDWLLERTILRRAGDRKPDPGQAAVQLAAEIETAAEGLLRDRQRIELFFDYWFMGARDATIRKRILAALNRYRESYLPLACAVVREQPDVFAGIPPEALAGVVTGLIEGCALQAIVEPGRFNARTFSAAVTALLCQCPAVLSAKVAAAS